MDNLLYTELTSTLYRSIIAFFTLYIITRLLGKKQISRLTFFDYVVGIAIGSSMSNISIGTKMEFYKGLLNIIIFCILAIIFSYISLKSYRAKRYLDGTATVLIQNGKIVEKNLIKTKLTIDDLLSLLRLNKAFNISDVEFAILETSGRLSVQLKAGKKAATPSDMQITSQYEGVNTTVIVDGMIINKNLTSINKDINWLTNELNKQNINSQRDILLATIDSNGNLHIDKKNSDPTTINI